MNKEQKIYLIGVVSAATASALITSAAHRETIRNLKNELKREKFVSDVTINAFARASKHMTKKEFNDVLFASIDEAKFERIVDNFKK